MITTFEDILSAYAPATQSMAGQLRQLLLERLNDIAEYPDKPANIIGYGYGSGYKDLICTIIPSKKGIKLGFNKGSELPDPQKLLTGSGKVHKYVEIQSEADIHNPAVKVLLNAALDAYKKRIKK